MGSKFAEIICRACLKQDDLMVNIYEHVEEQQTDLCTLLERCGDIKVNKSDNYSKLLCQECTKELLIAAKFRAKCAATEQILRQREMHCSVEDAASTVHIELSSEGFLQQSAENNEPTEQDIIEYDPSENVELYEVCETLAPDNATESDFKEYFNAGIYNCDDCGAVFQQSSTLQRHITRSHSISDIHKCDICGHSFTQHANLHKHSCTSSIAAVTTTDMQARHRCKYCGKCLQSSSSLIMHLRVHSGERPFACDACPKAFKTNGALITHQKRHLKLMKFNCPHCDKGFVESSNLHRHIVALHTAERPHTCIVCQRSFARVYLLELHKRTHTGERPYQCSFCSRNFAQLSVLRSHERTHTGDRPHQCSLCQKTFSRLIQLKKHKLKDCGQAKIAKH